MPFLKEMMEQWQDLTVCVMASTVKGEEFWNPRGQCMKNHIAIPF